MVEIDGGLVDEFEVRLKIAVQGHAHTYRSRFTEEGHSHGAGLSVSQAGEIAKRVEKALRDKMPSLGHAIVRVRPAQAR